MSTLYLHKTVAALPERLQPNAVYAVRVGEGVDLYVADATGTVAHKLNAPNGAGGSDPSLAARMQALEARVPNTSGTLAVDEVVRKYVQSRGTGLVTNGTGFMGDNTNFSKFAYTPLDMPKGFGSFTASTSNFDATTDEIIPIDAEGKYEFSFWARMQQMPASGTPLAYAYITPTDVGGYAILPHHTARMSFTLAAPLKTGDTVMHVAPEDRDKVKILFDRYGTTTTGFRLNTYTFTEANGYTYPEGLYSRQAVTSIAQARNLQYDHSAGTITGWPVVAGVNMKAGDKVSVGQTNATYMYAMMAQNAQAAAIWDVLRPLGNHEIPSDWTEYKATFVPSALFRYMRRTIEATFTVGNGFYDAGDTIAKISTGLQIGWLLNRGVTGARTAIGGVNFRQV